MQLNLEATAIKHSHFAKVLINVAEASKEQVAKRIGCDPKETNLFNCFAVDLRLDFDVKTSYLP